MSQSTLQLSAAQFRPAPQDPGPVQSISQRSGMEVLPQEGVLWQLPFPVQLRLHRLVAPSHPTVPAAARSPSAIKLASGPPRSTVVVQLPMPLQRR